MLKLVPLSCLAIAVFAVSSTSAASVSDLVINEIMADNETTIQNEYLLYKDWIEIHNPTGDELDLTGLFLSDDPDDVSDWPFPSGTKIPAGGHLIVWADNAFPFTQIHASFELSRNGEEVILTAADGMTIIDHVVFPALDDDLSYGRTPDASETFVIFDNPTPNESNQPPTERFLINEVLANNSQSGRDEANEAEAWVEIINASTAAYGLDGYSLTDDAGDPTRWMLPMGITLQPAEVLVVWLDGEVADGPLHASFALPASGGTVTLFSDNGAEQEDQVTIGALGTDVSRGRFPSGTDDFMNLVRPTLDLPNEAFDSSVGIVINEVLAANSNGLEDETGQSDDWIELKNVSGVAVDVSGFYLTDNLQNPDKWQIPVGFGSVIQPGGFLLVWADNDIDQDLLDGQFHADYQLAQEGEEVGLFQGAGLGQFDVIDSLVFPVQVDDASEARFGALIHERLRTAAPTPEADNAFALSLGDIADVITRTQTVASPELVAELDSNRDGVVDVADIVRRANLD